MRIIIYWMAGLVATGIAQDIRGQSLPQNVPVGRPVAGQEDRYLGARARQVRAYGQQLRQWRSTDRSEWSRPVSREALYSQYARSRLARQRSLGRPIRSVRERRAAGELDSGQTFRRSPGLFLFGTGRRSLLQDGRFGGP